MLGSVGCGKSGRTRGSRSSSLTVLENSVAREDEQTASNKAATIASKAGKNRLNSMVLEGLSMLGSVDLVSHVRLHTMYFLNHRGKIVARRNISSR